MPVVVGISFKKVGKVYYFDPAGAELHEGELVIAETSRGLEFGEVIIEPKDVPEEEIIPPLKKIVRKASPADIQREETNRQKEKQAFTTCQQKIQQHNLPMKLIDAEYCFDGSQVTFYFSAENRVDFRELVKDLASSLRTKVQLHQVGVRDEAKLFGGLGPCGRALCCSTFLSGFEPVSMKMAKEQSLFLNPLKFSGICGKLMCCLKFEYHTYRDAKLRLPGINSVVTTANGPGRVVEVNVIKETLVVEMEDGLILHMAASDLMQNGKPCQGAQNGCNGCGAHQAEEEPEQEEKPEPESKPKEERKPEQKNQQNQSAPQQKADGQRPQDGKKSGRWRGRRRDRKNKNGNNNNSSN